MPDDQLETLTNLLLSIGDRLDQDGSIHRMAHAVAQYTRTFRWLVSLLDGCRLNLDLYGVGSKNDRRQLVQSVNLLHIAFGEVERAVS